MSNPTRRQARTLAFQIIYHRAKIGIHQEGEKLLFENASLSGKHRDFGCELIDTAWRELNKIDSTIQRHLINWKQTRISDALNALLRISTSELLFFPETDGRVVFNEAIEICRSYVDERATKILNGVLHAVWEDRKNAASHGNS
ncbi:MAG: transcription antitermination factor NusB [Proteobacteria bacterium]|nr:transcription antitermination factor NusB [Pseudomonadota bacterium]